MFTSEHIIANKMNATMRDIWRIAQLWILLRLIESTSNVDAFAPQTSLFGVRPPVRTTVGQGGSIATVLQKSCRFAIQPLFAKIKDESDDEDWEPSEEDLLKDLEDLSLDDVVVDENDVLIEDDTMVMIVSDDDEEVAADEDDDDDDDEIDEELLDIWEDGDEEDEELEEEIDGEWTEDFEEESLPTSYLGSEQDYEDEEWDEDGGNSNVPLEDDPDDPDYMAQKKLVEETVARRIQLKADNEFDEIDYAVNKGFPPELAKLLESTDFIKQTSAIEDDLLILGEEDVKDLDLQKEMAQTSDLIADDPYDNEGRQDIFGTGLSDDDMQRMDDAYKRINKILGQEPKNKVEYKAEITDFQSLDNVTLNEMDACLDEIGGSSYNCTRWLLYDLDFNVSNLILAAVKHNPEAPVIFQHWFPQLTTYSRYEHARERAFDFNWDDVNSADVSELERYYQGFGYDTIPTKAPRETGIIGFEDLDEEELKMAAFENWMIEVYNAEWDRTDFDDDSFRDEDNVFSEFFEEPQHPDLPSFDDAQEDIRNWEDEMEEEGETNQEYKDFMVKDKQYEYVVDAEFQKEFRGHLIVACAPNDDDVAVAEKITKRMGDALGKQIYVETRVMAHARPEDNVFEVWLESYEIDLLHSKKRASSNAEGWDGPAECDDAQIENLVNEVRYLISDEARYSYRFQLDKEMVA